MKEKLKTFVIMAVGIFVGNYFIFENRKIVLLAFVSVFSGLLFALTEGYLKRFRDYIFKKVMKLKSH